MGGLIDDSTVKWDDLDSREYDTCSLHSPRHLQALPGLVMHYLKEFNILFIMTDFINLPLELDFD